MIEFKRIGKSKDFYDPLVLNPISVVKDEWNSFSIRKSSITNCDNKIYILNCKSPSIYNPCVFEEVITEGSCIVRKENDEKSYINLTIRDKDAISKFVIYYQVNIGSDDEPEYEKVDIFEFEGGDYNDLLNTLNGFDLGFETTSYGVSIYFSKDYNGKTAILEGSEDTYILNSRFCSKRNEYVGINFCFNTPGCYRILLMKGDEKVAVSNPINVISYIPKNTQIFEYYIGGIYNRNRIELYVSEPDFVIEEEENILSNGKLYISGVTTRKESGFTTGFINHNEAENILSIMKGGFKINGKRAFLRGSFNKLNETIDKKAIYEGVLIYDDEYNTTSKSCGSGCSNSSQISYHIYDIPKTENVLLGLV